MFEWNSGGKHFHIREAQSEADFHAIEDVQRDAWGFNDLDIVPAATLMATVHAGGMVLGAFEGARAIGCAYAFPAIEDGRTSMHSHLVGVRPEYRNFHAGYYLKLAQRERAIEKGLDEITWTFDPLQSLNAHLNFGKLGVISRRYVVNFYGEETSSPLHQGFGTDRLWVRWLLKSERVTQRVSAPPGGASKTARASIDAAQLIRSALIYSEGSRPLLGDFSGNLSASSCAIEIPGNINALKEQEPRLGVEWREATRSAFATAIEAGFVVADFFRIEGEPRARWFYLLKSETDFGL